MKREQYWDALEKANEVRFARAEMKREISSMDSVAASLHRLAECLELSNPKAKGYAPWLHTLAVHDYLKWGTRVGVQKANRILDAALIPASRRLGELTDRERESLTRVIFQAIDGDLKATNGNETWAHRVIEEVA